MSGFGEKDEKKDNFYHIYDNCFYIYNNSLSAAWRTEGREGTVWSKWHSKSGVIWEPDVKDGV
jgi:hypothetical protein